MDVTPDWAVPPKADKIPGNQPEVKPAPDKPFNLKDELVGAGEAAFTLGSGAVGAALSAPYELGLQLGGASKEQAREEAGKFQDALTHKPRGAEGERNVAAAEKVTSSLPPVMGHSGEIHGPAFSMAGAAVKQAKENAGAVKAAPPGSLRAQAGVVKLGGGNWYPERFITEAVDKIKHDTLGTAPQAGNANPSHKAVADWLDKRLTPYIKKQMGTAEDPIRKLAEEGVHHIPERAYEESAESNFHAADSSRTGAIMEGTDQELMSGVGLMAGKSELARRWENVSDMSIEPSTVSRAIRRWGNDFHVPEWARQVAEKDSNARVYEPFHTAMTFELGFRNIAETLRDQLVEGNLKVKDLDRMGISEAVRLVDKVRKDKEAEAAKGRNNVIPVQDLGDGHRLVQLKAPGSFQAESDAMHHSVHGYEAESHFKPGPYITQWPGENYGHGGHAAIQSGKAEVYSVRDPKNKPLATIEIHNRKEAPLYTADEASRGLAQHVVNAMSPEVIDEAYHYFTSGRGPSTEAIDKAKAIVEGAYIYHTNHEGVTLPKDLLHHLKEHLHASGANEAQLEDFHAAASYHVHDMENASPSQAREVTQVKGPSNGGVKDATAREHLAESLNTGPLKNVDVIHGADMERHNLMVNPTKSDGSGETHYSFAIAHRTMDRLTKWLIEKGDKKEKALAENISEFLKNNVYMADNVVSVSEIMLSKVKDLLEEARIEKRTAVQAEKEEWQAVQDKLNRDRYDLEHLLGVVERHFGLQKPVPPEDQI